MSTQPLTHHEILGLVEPFTRRGRRVDLAASKRLERQLAFKPVEHAGDEEDALPLLESLQLDNPEPGQWRLTRKLTNPIAPSIAPPIAQPTKNSIGLSASRDDSLQAKLVAEGADPGELLACIDAVPPQRQFQRGAGFVIAQSHRLESAPAGTSNDAEPAPRLLLTRGVVRLDGLTLALRVPAVGGIPADFELSAGVDAGRSYNLPEDLLAVLGWDWTRLERRPEGWRSTLRLRGSGMARSADAERKLQRTAEHLAQTLAEPPARFHQRQAAARWGVVARRALPLLTCAGLIGGAIAVPSLGLGQDSIARMLIFHAPPLLLMLGICLREMPRFEIPPLPRASAAPTWHDTQAGA